MALRSGDKEPALRVHLLCTFPSALSRMYMLSVVALLKWFQPSAYGSSIIRSSVRFLEE